MDALLVYKSLLTKQDDKKIEFFKHSIRLCGMKIMNYIKKKTIDKWVSITIPSTGKEDHTKKNGKCVGPFVCRRSKKHKENPRSSKNRTKSDGIEITLAHWSQKTLLTIWGTKTSMKTQRLPPARQRKSDEHVYRS